MRITRKVAEKAGEDIKQLFLAKTATMANAYERMPGDLSIAISCKWKPSDDQDTINADIGIAFKVDECREKSTYKFTDGKFGPLFDRGKMSGLRKILFRDFGDLRRGLDEAAKQRKREADKKARAAADGGDGDPANSTDEPPVKSKVVKMTPQAKKAAPKVKPKAKAKAKAKPLGRKFSHVPPDEQKGKGGLNYDVG